MPSPTLRFAHHAGREVGSMVALHAAANDPRSPHRHNAVTTLNVLAAEARGESWADGAHGALIAGFRGEACPEPLPSAPEFVLTVEALVAEAAAARQSAWAHA